MLKREECAAAGIEFTEILVGIDGIGVMTSENNTAVECVTFGDLYGLVGPESDGVTSWADANNITGVNLPDAPLTIFGPGEESGTYDSFHRDCDRGHCRGTWSGGVDSFDVQPVG